MCLHATSQALCRWQQGEGPNLTKLMPAKLALRVTVGLQALAVLDTWQGSQVAIAVGFRSLWKGTILP